MLAQLKTVLIKEAIKLAFFRRVEYLEHQHLWVWLQPQNGQKQRPFFWNPSVYSCSEKWRLFHARNWIFHTTLCTTPFTEQRKRSITRIERGVGDPSAQLSKRTSTSECLVWETDASQDSSIGSFINFFFIIRRGWSSCLVRWSAASAVPSETLGLRPGCVVTGPDREVRGATHNWPSVVWVREGLAGKDVLVSSRTSYSCGGLGAVRANQGCQVHCVSSNTLERLTSGLDVRCVNAWLGCISEDAWLSTFISPEPVRELWRWDKIVATKTIGYHEIGEKRGRSCNLLQR